MEGNSSLEVSRSAATAAGPLLAGVLVKALSAPVALLLDALSFPVSGLLLWRMRATEPVTAAGRRGLWREVSEGLGYVLGVPVLTAIFRTAALWNFSVNLFFAIFLLFLVDERRLSPLTLGSILAMSGLGMLLGAPLAGLLRRRYGVGPTLLGSGFLAASSGAVLVAGGLLPGPAGLALLFLGQFVYGCGPMIFGINTVSLRQALTPDQLSGRVGATFRFVAWGTMPLGGLLGGILGSHLGLLSTMAVASAGMIVAVALLVLSPIPRLITLPAPHQNPDFANEAA